MAPEEAQTVETIKIVKEKTSIVEIPDPPPKPQEQQRPGPPPSTAAPIPQPSQPMQTDPPSITNNPIMKALTQAGPKKKIDLATFKAALVR